MIAAAILGLPSIRVVDIADILIVAALIYYLYRLTRGTNVMYIFWALVVLLVSWRLADALGMRLLGALLSAITSVGLVALVVIFQPEIRKFLLYMGTKTQLDQGFWKRLRFWHAYKQTKNQQAYDPYVVACMHMSQSKTGALIIFRRQNSVDELVNTGERISALASSALIEAIFFKNSPLHDGALIVQGNQLIAARCILPVTARLDIDPNLGLRHRSAIGVTEQLDVVSIVVSEETGAISYVIGGNIHHDVSPAELRAALEKYNC